MTDLFAKLFQAWRVFGDVVAALWPSHDPDSLPPSDPPSEGERIDAATAKQLARLHKRKAHHRGAPK